MTPNSLHARDIASLVDRQTDLDRHAARGMPSQCNGLDDVPAGTGEMRAAA